MAQPAAQELVEDEMIRAVCGLCPTEDIRASLKAYFKHYKHETRDKSPSMQHENGKYFLDALYNIAYGTDITWDPNITAVGVLEHWLLVDGRTPFQNEYLTDVTLAQWRSIVQAQGGMDGPFNCNRAMMRGYNTADKEAFKASTSPIVTKRTFLIVGDKDPIALPSIQLNNTTPYIPFLVVRTVPAKHFMQGRDCGRCEHALVCIFAG
ncbi:hypothetical protein GQ53DRAFT_828392 [Thozetella sp. PMI_491]|nr:hypothetical protein GQ53DRAFT_828392 [Thozetella sp. PMI_491]